MIGWVRSRSVIERRHGVLRRRLDHLLSFLQKDIWVSLFLNVGYLGMSLPKEIRQVFIETV